MGCIDGKCQEKVMDGKTFDPKAEARKQAAIAANKKDLEIAAAAKHKAEVAAAQAAAAEKTVEKAAVAEKKAEKDAAMSAQNSFPDLSDSDFGMRMPFLVERSSSSMRRHVIALLGGFTAGSVATLVVCYFRRGALM